MIQNVLSTQPLTLSYYNQYLELINKYTSISTNGLFCTYLNINKSFSTGEFKESKFINGIEYDCYNLIPIDSMQQSGDNVIQELDKGGIKMSTNLSMSISSIETPNLNDILYFNIGNFNLVYIVRGVSPNLFTNSSIRSNRLSLEYAPLFKESLSKLKIINNYVYSLIYLKNIPQKKFEDLSKVSNILLNIFNLLKFDNKKELYYVDYITPLDVNNQIYLLLNKYKDFSYFPNIKIPYGIKKLNDFTKDYDLSKRSYVTKLNILYTNQFDYIITNYNKNFIIDISNDLFYNLPILINKFYDMEMSS